MSFRASLCYDNFPLEYKANFAFPGPDIEFSTDNYRSILGFGYIEVKIEGLNIILQG